jgi:hypothetical protein
MDGIGEDVFTERLAVPLLPEVMVWLTDEVEIEYVKVYGAEPMPPDPVNVS